MKKTLASLVMAVFAAITLCQAEVQAEQFVFADEGTTESWSWAKRDIYQAYETGIVVGKEGNIFDAEGMVTRAEAATMLVRKKGIDPEQYDYPCTAFSDVGEAWYTKFVNAAYENKLIAGKGEGIFDPNGPLTRGEATAMLISATEIMATDAPDCGFTDIGGNWYTPYINLAYAYCYVSGVGENRFEPCDNVTRAQLAVMMNRIKEPEENPLVAEYTYNEQGIMVQEAYEYSRTDYIYDENTNLIQKKKYSIPEEMLQYTVNYEYDANGRLIKEQKTIGENAQDGDLTEYVYDTDGAVTIVVKYASGESSKKICDNAGNTVQYLTYHQDGTIKREYSYTYTKQDNQITQQVTESSQGVIISTFANVIIYDEKENIKEIFEYNSEGELYGRYRYTYDDGNKLIQSATYDRNGVLETLDVYEYDEKGNNTRIIYYSYIVAPR